MRWLLGELPALQERGLLSADAVAALRGHYVQAAPGDVRRAAILSFAVLGGLLVGLGALTLVAHNWEGWPRPLRAGLALALLAAAQALAGWALARRRASAAWLEGSAAFLALAVGTCLALVAQTYQIQEDVPSFVLVWSLLALPLVYLMRSTLTAVLYLIGVTTWSIHVDGTPTALLALPLSALAWLHVAGLVRQDPHRPRAALAVLVAALCLPVALGSCLNWGLDTTWGCLGMGSLFALYVLASQVYPPLGAVWQEPCARIGFAGVFASALALTFADAAGEVFGDAALHGADWFQWSPGLLLIAAVLALQVVVRRRLDAVAHAVGLFVPIGLAALGLTLLTASGWPALLLFNAYAVGLGIAVLVAGLRAHGLGATNVGMLCLAAWITCRFFATDVTFLLRGILFVVLGLAFLSVNLVLLRRREAPA